MKKTNKVLTRGLARALEGLVIEAVADGTVPYDSIEYAIRHRSSGSSTLQSDLTGHRLAQLEQQRRNLLFLVCRILQAAPGYTLHPSELAADVVGDLSCLSLEAEACLRNRMVRDSVFQTPIAGI